jgi:hypothetical protein
MLIAFLGGLVGLLASLVAATAKVYGHAEPPHEVRPMSRYEVLELLRRRGGHPKSRPSRQGTSQILRHTEVFASVKAADSEKAGGAGSSVVVKDH